MGQLCSFLIQVIAQNCHKMTETADSGQQQFPCTSKYWHLKDNFQDDSTFSHLIYKSVLNYSKLSKSPSSWTCTYSDKIFLFSGHCHSPEHSTHGGKGWGSPREGKSSVVGLIKELGEAVTTRVALSEGSLTSTGSLWIKGFLFLSNGLLERKGLFERRSRKLGTSKIKGSA